MKHHKPAYYFDGYKQIRYCRICGKEELELIDTECVEEDEKQVDNPKKKP